MIFFLKVTFPFSFYLLALGYYFSIVSCEMGAIFSSLRCGSVTGSNYLVVNRFIHLIVTCLSLLILCVWSNFPIRKCSTRV